MDAHEDQTPAASTPTADLPPTAAGSTPTADPPPTAAGSAPAAGVAPADIRAYLEVRTAGPAGWSPDGRSLLVGSNLSGTSQVHRLDLGAHPERPVAVEDLVPVTRFAEPVGAGYLPADPTGQGRDRLLLATDRGGDEKHQLFTASAVPAEPYRGPDDLDPLVVDPEHIHRPGGVTRDGRLLAYATNRRDGVAFDTWVRDLLTGDEWCVLATGGWTGPAGFSPDGRYLAVSELTERAGDNRVLLVDLLALPGGPQVDGDPDLPIGREHPAVRELLAHDEGDPASVGAPSWLPDSSAFFLSADVGRDHVAVWRGTPDGTIESVIETGWDTGAAVDWSGTHLLVTSNVDGITRVELRDPVTLEVRNPVPLPGEGVAGGFRFTRDGRWLVYAYSSARVPGDVFVVDTASATLTLDRLTVSPCDVELSSSPSPELVRFASFDGLEVPAFVHRPRRAASDGAPVGRAPVVVLLHGGPESQHRPSFSPLTAYLVDHGFAVVAPNVRGSTGYGKAYEHLDDVEKRLDAVADLAALHDWIGTQDDLDPDRVALYGGSYGGYLVLAGLAFQPERWAAGVCVVGMSSLVTFLQNTSPWRRAYREREYGSLEHHRDVLEAASPINRVDDIRAPLLLIHGANDPRVPLSEAEQIHASLTARGVRCDLRVYEDEGHGLAKLTNRIDAYPRVTAFLTETLRA